MYNQRHLTLKTPNKLSNRPDWDYSSYEKKNKNGGSYGLAEGNSFSTMFSGAKSDAHKGALIKNNAIGLVSEKVGEQKAQRLFSGLNNEEVAKSYSALEESYKIGKRQGSYIPPNRVDNPNYLSLVAASQVSREQNNKEAEKLFMQIAREVADNPAPKKENKSVEVSAGKTISAGDSIPIDTESFKKAIAEYNKQNPQPQYFQKTPYSAQPEVQKLSQTISTKNNNSAVSTISDISDEKTESGLSVEELAWLVDDVMSYNGAKLDGKAEKDWIDEKVGYSLIQKKKKNKNFTEYDSKMLDRLSGWNKESIYKEQGLDIGVYSTETNGKRQIVVVCGGSELNFSNLSRALETGYDWLDNFGRFGLTTNDIQNSIDYANKIIEQYPDEEILFVGFSKGGAEAVAMALETGRDAVLFNPASYNWSKFGLDVEGYSGNMASYIIGGEALSETVGRKLDIPGEKKIIGESSDLVENITDAYKNYLQNSNFKNIFSNAEESRNYIIDEISKSINLHSLKSFLKN